MKNEILDDLKQTLESISVSIQPSPAEMVKIEPHPAGGRMSKEEKINRLRSVIKGSKAEKLEALEMLRNSYLPDDAVFILNAIDDEEPEVRAFAAKLAGELKIREALGDLKIHLEDESDEVAEASLDSVMLIEDPFIAKVVQCVFKSGKEVDILCKVLTTPERDGFDVGVTLFTKDREIKIPSDFQMAVRGKLQSGAVLFPRKEALKRGRHILFQNLPPGEFKLLPGESVCSFRGEGIVREISFKGERVAASAGETHPEIWRLETDNINMSCTLEMEPDGNLIIRFSLMNYPLKRITVEFQVISKENHRILTVDRAGSKVPFTGEIELEPVGKELFGEKIMGRLDSIDVNDFFVIVYFK